MIDAKMMYSQSLNRANLQKITIKKDLYEVAEEKIDIETSPLRSIKGIGEKTIIELHSAGIRTTEDLKDKSEEELKQIIKSPLTLKSIISYINS